MKKVVEVAAGVVGGGVEFSSPGAMKEGSTYGPLRSSVTRSLAMEIPDGKDRECDSTTYQATHVDQPSDRSASNTPKEHVNSQEDTELAVQWPNKPHHNMVSIYWDYENLSAPKRVSAYDIVKTIRDTMAAGYSEFEFVVVVDVFRTPKAAIDQLTDANAILLHVDGKRKNAADVRLRSLLRRFTQAFRGTNAKVTLLTSDIDFLQDSHPVTYYDRTELVRVHNETDKDALKDMAGKCVLFKDLIALVKKQGFGTSLPTTSPSSESARKR
ncbi:meiosis regulator and mRNA stability factor 1-like [Dermacentor variabilis]|uniref:meiosis regulator and mRNA stability factor 1-like n=1 Tax=Dermacentor variabilis TaxID=34621 RepID=UPI003F5B177C